ncbi:tRNA epoxyqueuosine(34) reductase QueG [Brucella pseudogrignonensis]|uniref:tRNA epoxyqueuosine(34) reductase QueG n=1 Tax=Brucella TaxID=234 RepID=UPI000DE309F0|nr:tRNA epoxyqueuosine(34) reductase QueG [Brucella pseudogrignonensis]MBK0023544.1 tRNA epoxyqueuosine(34) reductase QueG [Ochrobactrum sp. S45]MBK0045661.1 tRNA epoxyqueuosine(34) reductase QueG [Ochrobactrum sp. S46]UKK92807.1 tRNA epoxyqueuosine(34) reductase QueG [Brucella pseudogrignonensis]
MATSTSDNSQASDKALKLKRFLIEEAKAVGFDAVAFTGPDAIPQAPQRLRQYIADGHHADMLWMEETEERRANPSVLWPEVRSIMVLAMNYGPDSNPLSILEHKDRAAISVYAQNRDYHDIIKGKLKHIASRFAARAGQDVKVFVDTAPVMEKPLAQAAGLGWQGKHTNLVSRGLGSWLFLGSIFTTAEIPPDEPDRDHCGSCRACLDACPTKAFPSPYRIDAGRCISYLTIENKGPIPHEFRKAMGNRIYGCDDCLSVCPWNKFAQATSEMKLKARDDLKAPKLADFLALDDPAFRTLFSGSPVKRIGRDRFLRNVLIATGNSEDQTLVPQVESLLEDPAPVVRGAAVWALKQLVSTDRFKISQKRLASREEDATVRAEWSLEHQSD